MQLDYSTQNQLRSLTETLNDYRRQIDAAAEEIEIGKLNLEKATREADQVESEIGELLKSVARPSIVVVDGSVYELYDVPADPPAAGVLQVYQRDNTIPRFVRIRNAVIS